MVSTIISHEVADFDKWLEQFNSDSSRRDQHGVRIKGVYRNTENPNKITVVSEADSQANYDGMMGDPAFAEIMQKAGVISKPEMSTLVQ